MEGGEDINWVPTYQEIKESLTIPSAGETTEQRELEDFHTADRSWNHYSGEQSGTSY